MNSSTLRRLAADHAMLHSTALPPCYLFPPSSTDSSVDDLTQLTVLITGPTGTPYSQGLWRLCLKMPEIYPKAPPKATFRTRIWHPNVDEVTGSVCVDTLKKDWQPKLTLRDALITIYCLLIQPNPDSALNATAGHLLQDDYDSFARQARLMTSIHASIPSEMKDLAELTKGRGDTAGTARGQDTEERLNIEGESASSLSRTADGKLAERTISVQSAASNPHQAREGKPSLSEDKDDNSASKENDLTVPVPAPSPRRSSVAKRPLSDIPIAKPGYDVTDALGLNSSEENVPHHVNSSAGIAASDSSPRGLQLSERGQAANTTGPDLQYTGTTGVGHVDIEERRTKRIRSDSGKENTLEARVLIEKPLPVSAVTKVGVPASRQAPASSSSGVISMKGRSRVGLKRL